MANLLLILQTKKPSECWVKTAGCVPGLVMAVAIFQGLSLLIEPYAKTPSAQFPAQHGFNFLRIFPGGNGIVFFIQVRP